MSQQVSSVATSLSSIQVRQPSVQSNQLAVNFPNQVVSASSNSNFSGPTPPGKRMQPGSQPSSLKLPASQTYSYNSGLTFSSSHPASYFATPPPGEQVYPNQQLLYSRNLSHPPSYFTWAHIGTHGGGIVSAAASDSNSDPRQLKPPSVTWRKTSV